MQYFKKINLKCEQAIKEFAITEIENYLKNTESTSTQHSIRHDIPLELKNTINNELLEIGFPKIWYAQSYVRKKNTKQGIHIDGNDTLDEFVHSAVNIPLKGTAGSWYHWYTGNFKFHQAGWSTKYYDVSGLDSINYIPVVDEKLELTESYLIRVGRPHQAIASNEDRWIFTMRFEGNPKFEDLIKLL